jgi:hypothetical protein
MIPEIERKHSLDDIVNDQPHLFESRDKNSKIDDIFEAKPFSKSEIMSSFTIKP